eukprot:2548885-Amphidinium_carterae.1
MTGARHPWFVVVCGTRLIGSQCLFQRYGGDLVGPGVLWVLLEDKASDVPDPPRAHKSPKQLK